MITNTRIEFNASPSSQQPITVQSPVSSSSLSLNTQFRKNKSTTSNLPSSISHHQSHEPLSTIRPKTTAKPTSTSKPPAQSARETINDALRHYQQTTLNELVKTTQQRQLLTLSKLLSDTPIKLLQSVRRELNLEPPADEDTLNLLNQEISQELGRRELASSVSMTSTLEQISVLTKKVTAANDMVLQGRPETAKELLEHTLKQAQTLLKYSESLQLDTTSQSLISNNLALISQNAEVVLSKPVRTAKVRCQFPLQSRPE